MKVKFLEYFSLIIIDGKKNAKVSLVGVIGSKTFAFTTHKRKESLSSHKPQH